MCFIIVHIASRLNRSALALDIALVGVGAHWHLSCPWCSGTWSPSSSKDYFDIYGFCTDTKQEFEMVLGMAERFSLVILWLNPNLLALPWASVSVHQASKGGSAAGG